MDDEENEDVELAMPPADWAAKLLRFWFEEHADADWFGGGPEFDQAVTTNFAGWREALRSQTVDAFLGDAQTALAAIILFDQVPRNAYR